MTQLDPTIKVPGKLILAGEYAITKKNRLAIVFAVDKFLTKKKSELNTSGGKKYGLGSSGAFAVLRMRSNFPNADDNEIFRRALHFSRKMQPKNSGADIAASTYGGMLVYRNEKVVKKLSFPSSWHINVGWTGSPALTKDLVKKNKLTQKFLYISDQNVKKIIEAIETKDFGLFSKHIILSQRNLENLEGVMTDKLSLGIELAKQIKSPAKISGAGGGDNLIAFTNSEKKYDELNSLWKKNGIKPLNIKVFEHNDGKLK